MSLLSRFVKPRYKDEQLCARAEAAIAEDPLTNNLSALRVSSENGVLLLAGTVTTEREKNHIEGTVRSALRQSGLKFQRLENQIQTSR